uniref:HTH La-type RNA-binding domain-containing protein n=1 Tax=Aureoumbra lagunensis TaxID=44058 RepID=A0A7S3JNF0_9STRA|mmetsp:Transcript_3282/g.4550  ORF Transcript_3282/g.4550 Transcript_3282/m.4550 type:complete len:333 (+) Transcript_3282:39-1037(+)
MSSEEQLASSVLRQVEYYFSDESFPFDDYMKSKSNEEGWIEIEEIMAFPKMRQLTKEKQKIINALAMSDSVQVSADGNSLSRKFPMPDKDPDAERTIYINGFASTTDKEKMEITIKTWSEKHGTVEAVRALRNLNKEDRILDGSAFVKYKTKDSVPKALAASGTVSKGNKITVYTSTDYFERIQKKKESIARKKKEKEQADDDDPVNRKIVQNDIPKGSILSITLANAAEDIVRDDLKALFTDTASIKYVEFKNTDPVAYIRFESAEHAKAALDAYTTNPTQLKDNIQVQVAAVQGQAELDYIERANQAKRAATKRKHSGGKKGGYSKRARK